jgi:hypothetical protein
VRRALEDGQASRVFAQRLRIEDGHVPEDIAVDVEQRHAQLQRAIRNVDDAGVLDEIAVSTVAGASSALSASRSAARDPRGVDHAASRRTPVARTLPLRPARMALALVDLRRETTDAAARHVGRFGG